METELIEKAENKSDLWDLVTYMIKTSEPNSKMVQSIDNEETKKLKKLLK